MTTLGAAQTVGGPDGRPSLVARSRPVLVYAVLAVLGAAVFLFPFWLPSSAAPDAAHRADAPFVTAVVAALALAAVALEVRRGTMNGTVVAVLAVLASCSALARLLELVGGGNAIFFLVILAGAAFGPRMGLLLGLTSMAASAVLTGGLGPWLPFQMLALAGVGTLAGFAGVVTRRLPPWGEVVVLAVVAWCAAFAFGAVMNLWFWPYAISDGPLAWNPSLTAVETLRHYWSFYVVTSFAWDAAGAVTNAAFILILGRPLLRAMRRFTGRCAPTVAFVDTV